jgi:hypothetical protein
MLEGVSNSEMAVRDRTLAVVVALLRTRLMHGMRRDPHGHEVDPTAAHRRPAHRPDEGGRGVA